MKRNAIIIIGLLFALKCPSATHYVVTNNAAAANPYTNWATAGTNIIDVVNAAMTNMVDRVVWVSNGMYYLTNQVRITNALTLCSVNGREVTIMNGNYPSHTNRCVTIASGGAVLDGFTITNGYNRGEFAGGVVVVAGATVANCRITGCITTNSAGLNSQGGGAYVAGVMTNCEIIGNINYNTFGGGVFVTGAGLVTRCVVAANVVVSNDVGYPACGGGIDVYNNTGVVISDCTIYGNYVLTVDGQGGGVRLEDAASLRNSLVCDNSASRGGGVYDNSGIIQSCTIVSNHAAVYGGGIYSYSLSTKTVRVENVINYLNTAATSGSNLYAAVGTYAPGSYQIVNSCVAPTNAFPTSGIEGYCYANNIESNPQFVNKDSNDFHLSQGSPCINSGMNESWMTGVTDLDGHSRIDRFSGVVDMGCYEYLSQGMMFSVP